MRFAGHCLIFNFYLLALLKELILDNFTHFFRENNAISIYNNGKGIPVIQHKEEKMYVPTLIFGHLLTSSNYNDEEQKVTGGRNGYGAKLCNIFSKKFIVETSSKDEKKQFKQVIIISELR